MGIVWAGGGPVECASGTNRSIRWYRRSRVAVVSVSAVTGTLPPPVSSVTGRRAEPPGGPTAPLQLPARADPIAGVPLAAMAIDPVPDSTPVLDRLGRRLHDLRISVTDRCNFRCTYCMPREIYGRDFAFLPRSEVLTFEEIERLARVFVAEGVEKLRITGGEPLVRRDLPELIRMLAGLRRPDGGPLDLTLTTNGSALRSLAGPLRDAGLRPGHGQP